jgi:SAM-dependent methyltransferase
MLQLQMIKRACPVCGTKDDAQAYAEANVDLEALDSFAFASRKMPEYMHWRLVACRRCDLLYANPIPDAEDLSALYRTASFDSAKEAAYSSQTYGRFLPQIASRLPDRRGAVDIGTGDGAFLHELLAAGFTEVIGVEPSAAPIEVAAPEVRPLIRHDIFRPDSFAPSSLSLITCFQTMEHLSNPLAMCTDAWRALKPGGALFLIGHNRRALSAKLLGRKSPIFDIEHLQLFSPASVKHMLESAGFSRVTVQPVINRYPLHYWARLFPFPARLKRGFTNLLKSTALGRIPIPLAAGNLAAIAYK